MGKAKLKISQFVPFLPYGLTSKKALLMCIGAIPSSPAYTDYDPSLPMDKRVEICERMTVRSYITQQQMQKGGFIDAKILHYGQRSWQRYEAIRLTKNGLCLLAGRYDPYMERARINTMVDAGDAYLKAFNYISSDRLRVEFCNILKQQMDEIDPTDKLMLVEKEKAISDFLMDGVRVGVTTLLGYASPMADAVDLTTAPSRGRTLFRDWRMSNIEALFLVNGFLTSLDHKPLDDLLLWDGSEAEKTGLLPGEFPKDRSKAASTWPCWISKTKAKSDKYSVRKYTFETLEMWRNNHPASCLFNAPEMPIIEGSGTEDTQAWANTPAFYPSYSVYGYRLGEDISGSENAFGSANTFRRNFLGFAVGRERSYMMYHTQPVITPWQEHTEATSLYAVNNAISKCKTAQEKMGTDRQIAHAIMVCHTVEQFKKLFENFDKKIPTKWKKLRSIVAPYQAVNIVPINLSGAMEMRGLMLTSPANFERIVMHSLCEKDSNFRESEGGTYQLTYRGEPVLLAHTMDFQRLYDAWQDWQAGKRFYTVCYPQQAKFISKLMPDVAFL